MSLRIILAASAVLALAAPAFAQEAPAPAPAAAAEEPSPEFMAAVARIEAVGERIEDLMEGLEAQAAEVRADASLSDEDKATRIRAMMAEHQADFDEFGAAFGDFIRLSAMAEGASAEEAAAAAAAVPVQMMAIIEEALISGESDDEDDGDHEGH